MAGLFRVNFYPRDWLVGIQGLTLEEQGLYWNLCTRIYDRGAPLPYDEKELIRLTGCDFRVFRRVLAALIDKGKLSLTDGCLANDRCAEELRKVHHRREASAKGGSRKPRKDQLGLPGELGPSYGLATGLASPEVETGFLQNQGLNGKRVKSLESIEEEETPSPASTSSQSLKNRALRQRLPRAKDDDAAEGELLTPSDLFQEVGNRVLEIIEHGRGGHPTLRLNFSRVQIWLRNGADPELDIYPTVERVMANRSWDPPGSLNYFDRAIADAVAARTKPMPNGAANGRAPVIDAHAERTDRARRAADERFARAYIRTAGQGRDAVDPDDRESSADRRSAR